MKIANISGQGQALQKSAGTDGGTRFAKTIADLAGQVTGSAVRLTGTCGQAQATAVPEVAWISRVAVRSPAVPGFVDPAAATKHTGRA